ncbi:MAG: hypothetical protein WC735_01710 [Candidatus Paceibacterota bacterium]
MFTHPRLLPGEVWIGNQVMEVVYLNASIYRQHGVPSARVGKESVKVHLQYKVNDGVSEEGDFEGRSIFVNLNELIAAMEKDELEHPVSA